MKAAAFLLIGLFAVVFACEENETGFPNIADGTYHLEIYNAIGIKTFERDGEAHGLGSEAGVSMTDPLFASEPGDFDKFAFFFLSTSLTFDQAWDTKSCWLINDQSARASIYQRYYSLPDDWGYESISGSIKIFESTEQVLKGHFRIKMQAIKNDSGPESKPNPKWGNEIVVTGDFASIGY